MDNNGINRRFQLVQDFWWFVPSTALEDFSQYTSEGIVSRQQQLTKQCVVLSIYVLLWWEVASDVHEGASDIIKHDETTKRIVWHGMYTQWRQQADWEGLEFWNTKGS